jgi:hypothetical protein
MTMQCVNLKNFFFAWYSSTVKKRQLPVSFTDIDKVEDYLLLSCSIIRSVQCVNLAVIVHR